MSTEPIKTTVTFTCDVEVIINDPDAITRVIGPNGDAWRSDFYPLHDEQDVIEHFAFNCLANGCENISGLDGWAGLSTTAVTMRIKRDSIEVQEVRS